jgi:DNA-binding transcriptional regulator/RsmH inhibitor MraZ
MPMNQQNTNVTIKREYEAKLDSKRRILLRKPSRHEPELRERYLVRHREDGVIELRPQVMVDVASISGATLHMIDQAMENLQEGVAGDPVDLDETFPDL